MGSQFGSNAGPSPSEWDAFVGAYFDYASDYATWGLPSADPVVP